MRIFSHAQYTVTYSVITHGLFVKKKTRLIHFTLLQLTFYRILMYLTSQNHSLGTIFFCWLTYTYSTTSLLACSTYSILSATAGLRLLSTHAPRLLPKIHLATRSTRSELSIPVQKVSDDTTDGRSVSPSWCRDPCGAYDRIFVISLTSAVFAFVGRPL
jgi:hypothetical protein